MLLLVMRGMRKEGMLTGNGFDCGELTENEKSFDNNHKVDPFKVLRNCNIAMCEFKKILLGNLSVIDKETTKRFYDVLAKEFDKIASGSGNKTYIFPDKELKYLEDRIRKQEDGVYYCEAKILDTEGKLTQIGKIVGQLMLSSVSDRISEKEVSILYKVDYEDVDKNKLNEAIANAEEVKGKLNSESNIDGVCYDNIDNGYPGLE